MNPLYPQIKANILLYFRNEIRRWVAMSREVGIPSLVKEARLRRARALASECRTLARKGAL